MQMRLQIEPVSIILHVRNPQQLNSTKPVHAVKRRCYDVVLTFFTSFQRTFNFILTSCTSWNVQNIISFSTPSHLAFRCCEVNTTDVNAMYGVQVVVSQKWRVVIHHGVHNKLITISHSCSRYFFFICSFYTCILGKIQQIFDNFLISLVFELQSIGSFFSRIKGKREK